MFASDVIEKIRYFVLNEKVNWEDILKGILLILNQEIVVVSIGLQLVSELGKGRLICYEVNGEGERVVEGCLPDEIKRMNEKWLKGDNAGRDIYSNSEMGRNMLIFSLNTEGIGSGLFWIAKDKEASGFMDEEVELAKQIKVLIMSIIKSMSDDEIGMRKAKNFMEGFIWSSDAMKEAVDKAVHFANYDVPVLIIGETGTGKEELAKLIHRNSKNKSEPFVVVNCGAIPEALFESELFGHKKGSFTNAYFDRVGLLGEAAMGTIFFDEIGDLTPVNQVKLLRVIENKEYRKVGSNEIESVKARFIFATNKDLIRMVQSKEFREDLYYRISTAVLLVPPLRARGEDSLVLFRYFVKKYSQEYGLKEIDIDKSVEEIVKSYRWPGNVRELISLSRQLVLWHKKIDKISIDDLPSCMRNNSARVINFFMPLQEARDNFTKEYVLEVLKSCNYNKTKACSILKISRWGFHKLLTRLDIRYEFCNDKMSENLERMVAFLN